MTTPKLWTKKQAAEATGYSRCHLMRRANDPNDDFPAPIRFSANRVVFAADEITAWLQRRMADRPRKGAGDDRPAA